MLYVSVTQLLDCQKVNSVVVNDNIYTEVSKFMAFEVFQVIGNGSGNFQ